MANRRIENQPRKLEAELRPGQAFRAFHDSSKHEKASEIPEAERELHFRSEGITIDARTDQGGPGDDNYDAVLCGRSESGAAVFGAVIDTAGRSEKPHEFTALACDLLEGELAQNRDAAMAMKIANEGLFHQFGDRNYAAGICWSLKGDRLILSNCGDAPSILIDGIVYKATPVHNAAAVNGRIDHTFYTNPDNKGIYRTLGQNVNNEADTRGFTIPRGRRITLIMGSDGAVGKTVSFFELQKLALAQQGKRLMQAGFELANKRHKVTEGHYIVQHSQTESVVINGRAGAGDDATIMVVEINLPETAASFHEKKKDVIVWLNNLDTIQEYEMLAKISPETRHRLFEDSEIKTKAYFIFKKILDNPREDLTKCFFLARYINCDVEAGISSSTASEERKKQLRALLAQEKYVSAENFERLKNAIKAGGTVEIAELINNTGGENIASEKLQIMAAAGMEAAIKTGDYITAIILRDIFKLTEMPDDYYKKFIKNLFESALKANNLEQAYYIKELLARPFTKGEEMPKPAEPKTMSKTERKTWLRHWPKLLPLAFVILVSLDTRDYVRDHSENDEDTDIAPRLEIVPPSPVIIPEAPTAAPKAETPAAATEEAVPKNYQEFVEYATNKFNLTRATGKSYYTSPDFPNCKIFILNDLRLKKQDDKGKAEFWNSTTKAWQKQ